MVRALSRGASSWGLKLDAVRGTRIDMGFAGVVPRVLIPPSRAHGCDCRLRELPSAVDLGAAVAAAPPIAADRPAGLLGPWCWALLVRRVLGDVRVGFSVVAAGRRLWLRRWAGLRVGGGETVDAPASFTSTSCLLPSSA